MKKQDKIVKDRKALPESLKRTLKCDSAWEIGN